MNIFEIATRQKLRFVSSQGLMSVEDLWDLPLKGRGNQVDLDTIAKTVHKAIKEEEEESFVSKRSNFSTNLQVRMDIVKHIIDTKLEEADKREQAQKNKAKREKIKQILATKEDEELMNMSKEDLLKALESE